MTEWISVNDGLPENKLAICAVRVLVALGGDVTEALFYFGSRRWEACNSRTTINPTHWQYRPDPPPKSDAFEEWWQRFTPYDGNPDSRWVPQVISGMWRHHAKFVWDAAIASTKKP